MRFLVALSISRKLRHINVFSEKAQTRGYLDWGPKSIYVEKVYVLFPSLISEWIVIMDARHKACIQETNVNANFGGGGSWGAPKPITLQPASSCKTDPLGQTSYGAGKTDPVQV